MNQQHQTEGQETRAIDNSMAESIAALSAAIIKRFTDQVAECINPANNFVRQSAARVRMYKETENMTQFVQACAVAAIGGQVQDLEHTLERWKEIYSIE